MTAPIPSFWPAAKTERRPLAKLKPAERNARTHSDAQIAEIMASIREWGWTQPILVDESDRIIAGHGRLEAAKRLDLAQVPVVVARNWTEVQKRAYLIADNKIPLNAGWDDNLLRLEVTDLRDLGADISLTGFSADEVTALFSTKAAPADFSSYDETIETEHECPKCRYRFSGGSSKPATDTQSTHMG